MIHCLGPVYGLDEPAAELLASCYRNALRLAEDNGIASIAFSAISTGAFGYPLELATRIAFAAIQEALPRLSGVKRIRFVLYDSTGERIHAQVLDELPASAATG